MTNTPAPTNSATITLVLLTSLLLFGCENEDRNVDALDLAQFYIEQDNPKLALEVLGAESQKNPNQADVHRMIASILAQAEYYGDSVKQYNKAIELGCEQVCREGLVDAYLGQGLVAEARREHSRVANKGTEVSRYHEIILDFHKRRNYSQTIEWLEQSSLPVAQDRILSLKFLQGQYAEIAASYQDELTYSEEQMLVFASAFYELGRYQETENILRKFDFEKEDRLLTRRTTQAAELLTRTLYTLDKKAEGDSFYQQFLETNQGSRYAILQGAKAKIAKSEFAEALVELNKLNTTQPIHPQVAQLLSRAHFGMQDFQAVVNTLEPLKESLDQRMLLLLADAYNRTGRPHDTLSLIEPTTAGKVEKVMLARAYLLEKKPKLSRSLLQTIEIEAENPDFNLHLAELWVDLGEHEKVIDAFAKQTQQPQSIQYLVLKSYLKLGRVGDARRYVEQEPDKQKGLELKGFLEASTGNLDGARGYYETLVQEFPSSKSRLLLASIWVEIGEVDKALVEMKAAFDSGANNRSVLRLANKVLLESNHDSTYRWLDGIKPVQAGYDLAQMILASHDLRRGENDRASERLMPMVNNGETRAIYLLAKVRQATDPEESVKLFEVFLDKEYSNEVAILLHRYYLQNGDLEALRRINDKIAKYAGVNESTATILARGYFALDQYQQVWEMVETLRARGEVTAAIELSADILTQQGKFEKARDVYKRLLDSEGTVLSGSESILIKYFAARLKAADEDTNVVLADAEAVLTKSPEMHLLRNLIATNYIERDSRAAIKHLRILNEKFPENVIFLNNLAWASLDLYPADALKYSEKAYIAQQDNEAVVDTYMQALMKNNQNSLAKSILESKLEQDPDNATYKNLLQALN